jgi:demethylmenaquinone methyltransferase/2-methoxy-6-polyprenyl-1,4-benzoquinol methylase
MAVLHDTDAPVRDGRLPVRVFSPIARGYDRPAQVLGLLQYRRWHRFLLSRLDVPPEARVLDMATGTGALAIDLLMRTDARVVGADVTRPMLAGRAAGRWPIRRAFDAD